MSTPDYERARSALAFISPDDRDTWLRMGMAVKDGFGEEGFEIWDKWSRQSDAYVERDARDVWKSIKRGGGITLGTLFREATVNGWRDDGGRPTPEELEVRRRQASERNAKEEAEKVREHAKAASKASALWEAATPGHEAHPYLVTKGVSRVPSLREIDAGAAEVILGYAPKCDGNPLAGRLLVVPIKIADKLSTLEMIDEGGHKSALSGGKKSGGFWAAQPLPDGDGTGTILLIGEGVVTVLSAREATGGLVIAALTDTNLLAVARSMRQRFPAAVLVILADLIKTTGEPNPHAIEAARAVGGLVAIPEFGKNRPDSASDFNDLHQHAGLEIVAACIAAAAAREDRSRNGADKVTGNSEAKAAAVQDPEWPHPMDPRAYYGLAGEMVKAIEPHTEADPVALLLQILVAFGVWVGRTPYVQVEGDRHYANLFALLMGGTSKGRKGTSWGRVRSVFERVLGWLRVVSGLSSGEGLKWQVRDPVTKLVKNKKSGQTEEVIDEGVTDKRLLVIEPEFAAVTRVVARQGNTLSSTARGAWDTGNLATLTKHDPITATGAHIAIIGHVTVDELRAELTQTDTANGFANRFLFLCVKRSKCLPFGGEELPESVVTDFARRLEKAGSAARRVGRVTMTEAARRDWERVYPSLSEGMPGLFGAATARAEAQVVRLAMICALLDEKTQIDEPHLRAALAVWEYCEASAQHVFGASLGDPIADEILRELRSAGQDGMPRTQISGLFHRHCPAWRIGAALDLLSRHNLARQRPEATGGRPSEVWVSR